MSKAATKAGVLAGGIGAGIALAGALLFCGALVFAGPRLAEGVLGALGVADPAAGEALFTLLIFGVLLLAAVVAGAVWGVNALAPGERPAPWAGAGLALGLGGIGATTGYAALAGTLATSATAAPAAAGMVLLGIVTVLVQVLAEEAFFRGWLQPVLVRGWGVVPGLLVGALAFAVLHIAGGAREPMSLINLVLGGVVFGTLALLGRGIVAPLAMHLAWNGAEQLLFGLDPNPGVGGFGAIWDLEMTGAGLWGGSGEGLNASLGMTLVLLAVLLPLLAGMRQRLATPPRAAAAAVRA